MGEYFTVLLVLMNKNNIIIVFKEKNVLGSREYGNLFFDFKTITLLMFVNTIHVSSTFMAINFRGIDKK